MQIIELILEIDIVHHYLMIVFTFQEIVRLCMCNIDAQIY